MFTLLIFIIVLGLLVFVHELGHFIVARSSGMQVDEFGFGFPPRIVGVYKTAHGKRRVVFGPKTPSDAITTIYSINAIPLGGFVKIVGENNDAPDNLNSFGKKSFFARLATLLAGVTMNVILGWVLLSVAFMSGVPSVVDEQTTLDRGARLTVPVVTILDVASASPGARDGLKMGDAIVAIDGRAFESISDVQSYVREHKGGVLTFTIKRAAEILQVPVATNADPPSGEGPTGIALGMVGKLTYSPIRAFAVAARETGVQLKSIVLGLGQLVLGHVSLGQVGGPVKIAQLTGQASQLGFAYLMQFAAFLSLNLAILNALPIPALDGGRVLFLVIEKLRRRPNNPHIEQTVNAVGFLALLLLMLVVTINDFHGFAIIGRLFGK